MADKDGDGIPDLIDKNPNKFDATPQNSGGTSSKSYSTYGSDYVPDVPNIMLPWLDRPVTAAEAKSSMKFAGTRGGKAKIAYDRWTAALKAQGIPAAKADEVWADALEWTQTLGSTTSDPTNYISVMDPSRYIDESTRKYGTQIQKQVTTTEYSTSAAASDIDTAFQRELGREATPEQALAYQKAVNKEAAKSPAIYQGSTTTSPGGASLGTTSTKATSKTGFDPTIFARDFARSQPDFAESYAAKEFLKLIDQALTDPNRIGQVVE
jgi:hypothetical protein